MIKFFVDPSAVEGAHIYIEDKGDLKHLTKVLRAKVGDEVQISDGAEWEYETVIEDLDETVATLKIIDKQKFAKEPETWVTLYQGVPKASKMETIIQKNVELGIHAIVPVFMGRSVVVEKGNFDKKLDRWQKIADEAVKQCKRGIIPEVKKNQNFKEMLQDITRENYDLVLLAYENEAGYSIKDALKDFTGKPKSVAIIIGPEGGLSDDEVEAVKALGAKVVTLGKTILRTETAGMAATAMIMYELEL